MRRRHVFSHRGRGRVRAVRGGIRRGRAGMTSCDVCAPGSTAAAAGTAVCAPCVAGTVAPPAAGSAVCAACDDFFFAAAAGSTACAPCPAGFLSGRARGPRDAARACARTARSAPRCARRWTRRVRGERDEVRVRGGPRAGRRGGAGVDAPGGGGGDALATVGGMCWLGHAHWSRQRLLVKYAGGETFYEEMIVASASSRGGDRGDGRGGGPEADFDAAAASLKAARPDDADRALDAVLARHPRHARARGTPRRSCTCCTASSRRRARRRRRRRSTRRRSPRRGPAQARTWT